MDYALVDKWLSLFGKFHVGHPITFVLVNLLDWPLVKSVIKKKNLICQLKHMLWVFRTPKTYAKNYA